jgi:hypothetical protein
MNGELSRLMPFVFVLPSLPLSISYVTENKITVHFTCILHTLYIFIPITGYMHALCGTFKGFSSFILIIRDFGFTCRH